MFTEQTSQGQHSVIGAVARHRAGSLRRPGPELGRLPDKRKRVKIRKEEDGETEREVCTLFRRITGFDGLHRLQKQFWETNAGFEKIFLAFGPEAHVPESTPFTKYISAKTPTKKRLRTFEVCNCPMHTLLSLSFPKAKKFLSKKRLHTSKVCNPSFEGL